MFTIDQFLSNSHYSLLFSGIGNVIDKKITKLYNTLERGYRYLGTYTFFIIPAFDLTDFMAALRLILRAAVKNKIPAADMPTKLLVLSDMQFDHSLNMTVYREIVARYHRAGYRVPELVFWNLSARHADGQMVTRDTKGTCSISGYSPVILKEVLKGSIPNPYTIMLNTVGDPKYAFPVHTHIRGGNITSAH